MTARCLAVVLACAWHAQAVVLAADGAADALALPSPLTLDQALAVADEPHPALAAAQARLDSAQAGLEQARSTAGVRSFIDLTPQWVQPSTGTEAGDFVNDSRARLYIQKRLYDFGRTRALEQSASSTIQARELAYLDARQKRRIEIMQRFLDVVLADLRYSVDNEAMAHIYVSFDRGRERHKLGQLSDVDLLELENGYQESRIARYASQARQAASRQQLALALNRPEQLPADVVRPALPANDREIPEYRAVFDAASKNNPVLTALRHDVEAARARLGAERARRYPVVSAELEAAKYEREFNSRDDVRATLNLRIPLYQGGEDSAAIGAALAHLHEQEAKLAQAEYDLRQTVLDLVQELETLRVARQAAKVRVDYRDLYQDRTRSMYELEIRASMGDAMTRSSEAQWNAAKVEFQLALVWARIDALTGHLIQPSSQEPQQ